MISSRMFKEKTGKEPEQDDLERASCRDAGKVGHWMCGWCYLCDLPVFMCSCETPERNKEANPCQR